LLAYFISDPSWTSTIDTFRGLIFVVASAVFFYFILNQELRQEHKESAEQRRAETTSNQLAAIVESSDDAIISKDLNSIITSWNEGAERILGYTSSDMVGTSIMRLVPTDRAHA
jgi:PAS domain-containing protein